MIENKAPFLKHVQQALIATMVCGLMACGGGGGSAGTTVGTPVVPPTPVVPVVPPVVLLPTFTLSLQDAIGASRNSVTTASPLTIKATVKDSAGKPVVNALVGFKTKDANLTTFAPLAGTALTNAAGVASVSLSLKSLEIAQTQAGAADEISAAVTVGDQVLEAKATYAIGTSAISLRLVTPNPALINLKAYETTPISVDVLTDNVLYTAQPVTVNFSSACANGKADLPVSASTINGRAQVVYRDKGCSATDTVTASVSGATSVTASLVIAPPLAASIGFVSGTPSDKAIVIKGAGGNGRTETAVLTFQALDTFGNPLPNQVVNFSVNPPNVVTLQSNSATTGADGKVIVAVSSGSVPTTFRVNATLTSGQSTLSDTITVTTGQPIQAAFSLSAESFNIEGWNRDNEKTKINALIADSAGNPVADGTPVVFQADSGAVGSASLGGCLTLNGACSVEFRSQEPRHGKTNTLGKRPGMATVTASSTSATLSLSKSIAIFLSGSSATMITTPAGSAFSTLNCGNFSLQLEVYDENSNPMPAGTTVTAINTDKVSIGSIFPATVPSIGAPSDFLTTAFVVGVPVVRASSMHLVPVKPDTVCKETGTPGKGIGTFDILVKSPSGIGVIRSFSLSFPVP